MEDSVGDCRWVVSGGLALGIVRGCESGGYWRWVVSGGVGDGGRRVFHSVNTQSKIKLPSLS